jgi:magnesium transporter
MDEREIAVEDAVLQRPDYQRELLQIIRSGVSPKVLKEKIQEYHENDIAAALEMITKEERIKLYHILDAQRLSDIFEYLEEIQPYFEELTVRKRVGVLSCMEADTAVNLLRELPKAERSMLIDLMDDEAQRDITMIASFDEDEIGSRMTTNFIEINSDLSVKQAMHALVSQAAENDNISTIYVIDDDGTFYGAIDLKDLIIAREGSSLDDIIMTSYPYVYAQETIDDCIERMKDYSEDSIPVLGNDNKLLGVITAQSMVEVIDAEMGEDYAKLAGLTAEEDLREPVKESIKKRMPWLLILLALGMIVSSVVGLFENVVSQLTIVMCFQSLILDMAGNVGTQSLAVTIRVLMDENLSGRQKLGLVWKEMRVGFMNGLILGSIAFVLIGGYIYLFKGKTLGFAYAVSGCIGAALLLAMLISSIAGTAIPMFFKKINVDPAVASGPLITTLNDLVAVVSYYGMAWLFLLELMHLTE